MSRHLLVARDQFDDSQLNWVFLVWYIVFGILTLFFLFAFNRLFAAILSYFVRFYTWYYYRVYVDIQSLQISPLAGRVFFKGVKYHGKNQSILIQDGYITWRYWKRRVQELDHGVAHEGSRRGSLRSSSSDESSTGDFQIDNETLEPRKCMELPCRVLVKVRGAQWFVYNRSPAYDAILQSVMGVDVSDEGSSKDSKSEKGNPESSKGSEKASTDSHSSHDALPPKNSSDGPREDIDELAREAQGISLPSILNILPIGVECGKAAVVMGNQNTQSILVAKIVAAQGKLTAQASRSVDLYKQVIDFDFSHPTVEFRHNSDYMDTVFNEGARLCSKKEKSSTQKAARHTEAVKRSRRHASDFIKNFLPRRRGSVNGAEWPGSKAGRNAKNARATQEAPSQGKWLGLTRYLDDEDDSAEQERWKSIEYAQVPTILDCPSVSMNFYWDVPGTVPRQPADSRTRSARHQDDINNNSPPDWGIDLKVRGGVLNYGPWADRQRADLQSAFFPPLYQDANPAKSLRPGQSRISTEMKIFVVIEEQITLHIPTREDSKDWKWKGQAGTSTITSSKLKKKQPDSNIKNGTDVRQGLGSRPFGWLDVKVHLDSTVSFTMDLVAKVDGYHNQIDADLKGVEISSSVNHGLLWRSQSQTISCDLSNPLGWNALRKWRVDLHDESLELFILRDHMFLMTDLINDWASGPTSEFYTFVPFEYALRLNFSNFRLYLNANDSNIIDNPADTTDNVFVVVWGHELTADLLIPMKNYRPVRNKVDFAVEASDGGFELMSPFWNTQHTLMESGDVAALKDLKISGSYNYFTSTSTMLTDMLLMDIHGISPRFQAYGFLIRYLMTIKDNYFGDDLHFRTMEEYQRQIDSSSTSEITESNTESHKRPSNDLDVVMTINADDCCASLPAHLYSASEHLKLEIYSASADLRITNYYMDLAVSTSPITASHISDSGLTGQALADSSKPQVHIDGLEFSGHRLFGLPPSEPTYVCNWDFDVGKVKGECIPEFLRTLGLAARCFALTFNDEENALPKVNEEIIHDVTILRARIQSVAIAIHVEDAALILHADTIKLDLNDWAGALFSDHLYAFIPGLTLAITDAKARRRKSDESAYANTHAYVRTAIELNQVRQKRDFVNNRNLQQAHVALHDARTQRVPWLVHSSDRARSNAPPHMDGNFRPPAMPFPLMPNPIEKFGTAASSTSSNASIKSKATERGDLHASVNRPTIRKPAGHSKSLNSSKQRKNSESLRTSPRGEEEYRSQGAVSSTVQYRAKAEAFENDPQPAHDQPGFGFTSPYKEPYFPLLANMPDPSLAPDMPANLPFDEIDLDEKDMAQLKSRISGEDAEKNSIIVRLDSGLRAFCTPEALIVFTRMLDQLQTDDVTSLLDNLQIDTIGAIMAEREKRKEGSGSTELRVYAPYLGVRFVSSSTGLSRSLAQLEQYELAASNFSLITRSSTTFQEDRDQANKDDLALHIILDHMMFSARECIHELGADQAVISVTLTEPMLWLLKASTSSAELRFGNLEVISASRRVDYISSLVRQTALIADDLISRFLKIVQKYRMRLHLFVMLLAKEGQSFPEPLFLSSASYVLRSATNHLRTSNSWRITSRLRYVQRMLADEIKEAIHDQCLREWNTCPQDAGQLAISFFQQWRNLDIDNLASTTVLRNVFGESPRSPAAGPKAQNILNASIIAQGVRLVFEPGISQNELVIEKLLLGFSTHPTFQGRPNGAHTMATTTISTHSSKFLMRLNWSLCELVENIVATVQSTHLSTFSKKKEAVENKLRGRSCLHVIVSSEESILNLDTINLKAVTVGRTLKASIVQVNSRSAQSLGSMSLIIDAAAAKTEFHSHSAALSVYNLHEPHLFGSQDIRQDGEVVDRPWKFVGSGRHIAFSLLKTPLELAEVVDNVIQDEVGQLTKWKRTLSVSNGKIPSEITTGKIQDPPRAHVALLLDTYLISVTILPSLIYEIDGKSIRSSIQCGLSKPSLINVNMDLQEQIHRFKTDAQAQVSNVANLNIPPINGYLRLDLAREQRTVRFRYFVEHISLSASALHALFDAVNQPAMIELGKHMQQEISLMQRHMVAMSDNDAPQAPSQPRPTIPFFYDASMIIVRLTVHSSAPDTAFLGQAADLDIDLGRIHIKTTNIDALDGSIMPISELQVQLNTIRVDITRPEDLDFQSCGNLSIDLVLTGTSKANDVGKIVRAFHVQTNKVDVTVYTETASAMVAILGHLQDTLRTIDLPNEVRDLRKMGRERLRREGLLPSAFNAQKTDDDMFDSEFSAMYSIVLANIRVVWKIGNAIPISPTREPEDLILSLCKIDLATKQDNAARLLIQDLQLQMAPSTQTAGSRSLNSALLPEVVFNVAYKSTKKDRKFAFQAVGKSLDLQITSQSILPANDLRRSIVLAVEHVRVATKKWRTSTIEESSPKNKLLSNKKLASLLIYADFGGAVVHIQGRSAIDSQPLASSLVRSERPLRHGRYNQFTPNNPNDTSTTLRAPSIALKFEYTDAGNDAHSLNAEMKVSASTNTLFPTVVPLIMEISSSIKEIIGDSGELTAPQKRRESIIPQPTFLEDERLRTADPSALLGNCKLNLGLRICRQEFSLSCQPIARVAAQARFEDIYITLNTVQSAQHGKFFTVSAAFTGLSVSVQHVYSRDSTGSFAVDSVVVSFMNSKHVSSVSGISAILRISPMKVQVNAKQLQDVLLFREIWVPPEIRGRHEAPEPTAATAEPQVFIVQRYQQIAATGAFPWNATVSIAELNVQLDLGQSLGKSVFKISDFWVSSRKSSDWEQYLCLGFDKVAVDSSGRMSGSVELRNFKVRTSIKWPILDDVRDQKPLVQASLSFDHLLVKAGFDFQAFLVANISTFDFLMYNVRDPGRASRDRLVGVLEGDKVQVFCTTTSASQSFALYQAFQRLIEEKQRAYEASLSDIEKFLRRKSTVNPLAIRAASSRHPSSNSEEPKSPLQLQTNVVVTLKAVNIGAFPSTFMDSQIFKFEALETSARFAVVLEHDRVHSTLGMTLGQLRVALSSVNRPTTPKTLGEVSIEDVVASATGSRGGTILKVPKVVATMQTWQEFEATHIDYIFKSSFQGKVDVGWNYSRISYIRGMYANHTRTLAQRLGKPLPQSAVQITGLEEEGGTKDGAEGGQEKITAVVNVPQSKYQYTALQPPIIETPQLRDMGEATPPLEWIGLQRDRLPNLTHQIVIVTLLEVAKEVDDAYSRILGSS